MVLLLWSNLLGLQNKLKKQKHKSRCNPSDGQPQASFPHPRSSMWALLNLDLCSSTGMFLSCRSSGWEVLRTASWGLTEMGVCPSVPLPPSSVEQFDFCQPLADHGGKEKGKENATDQHVVVVVFQHIELLRGIDPGLEDVQTISHHLQGKPVQHQKATSSLYLCVCVPTYWIF